MIATVSMMGVQTSYPFRRSSCAHEARRLTGHQQKAWKRLPC
jgi:hypothetical protein